MAHRACVIIWVRLGVHGTCVTGGADDKEDMIWGSIKAGLVVLAFLALAVCLSCFLTGNIWVE